MPVYVMLSTVGPAGAERLRDTPERLLEVNQEVEAMGVRILEQYALLGQYDFITIVEAPDERTMTRLAITLGARGTLKTTTLPAIPATEFVEALRGG